MSDSNTKANAPQGLKEQRERKARVNRIKIGIVLFLVIWLVACMVLDVVLMVRVSSLQDIYAHHRSRLYLYPPVARTPLPVSPDRPPVYPASAVPAAQSLSQ